MSMFDVLDDEESFSVSEDVADIYKMNRIAEFCYSGCEGCPLRGNTKVLNIRGSSKSKICFVGMNPGAKEKKFKLPFVGPSGVKFDSRVLEPLGLGARKRLIGNNQIYISGDFYLTNLVKCWTSNNADPSIETCAKCWKHLEKELVGREIIVLLGKLVQKVFKRFYTGSAILFDMIHPAAALRKGIYEAALVRDVKNLREEAETCQRLGTE